MSDFEDIDILRALNPKLRTRVGKEVASSLRFVHAQELIEPNRLDLIAKRTFAEAVIKGASRAWPRSLYRQHLESWNPALIEKDGQGKTSFEDYERSFLSIIFAMQEFGFDERFGLIPLDKNGVVIDGSHRVGAAAALGLPVPTVELEREADIVTASDFLKGGMPRHSVNDLILRYLQNSRDCLVAVVFPCAQEFFATLKESLCRSLPVFFESESYFSFEGALNLLSLLYEGNTWADRAQLNSFHYHQRFRKGVETKFFLFHSSNLDQVVSLKGELRELTGLGNPAIHISDSHEETIRIAESVLNENSIDFLNKRLPVEFPEFVKLLRSFRGVLAERGHQTESFVVDGGGVLAALGLRRTDDLDLIRDLNLGVSPTLPEPFHCRENQKELYGLEGSEAIEDPRRHFYYKRVKFLWIDDLRRFKQKRGEIKDVLDLKLIQSLKRSDAIVNVIRFRALMALKLYRYFAIFKRRYLRLKRRLRVVLSSQRSVRVLRKSYQGYQLCYSKDTSLLKRLNSGNRVYEPEVSEKIVQLLRDLDTPVFLDVGANIGLLSLNVARAISSAQIYAIEPRVHSHFLLEKTILLNDLSSRVKLFGIALGNRDGLEQFVQHESRDASGDGFIDTGRAGCPESVSWVPSFKLDTWWREVSRPRIDVVKLDTEGAENWILQGASEFLNSLRPVLVLEIHPENIRSYPFSIEDLAKTLKEQSYCLETLTGNQVALEDLPECAEQVHDYVAVPIERRGRVD